MARKPNPTSVDRILGILTPEDRDGFVRWARLQSAPSCKAKLDDLREEYAYRDPPVELPYASLNSVATWCSRSFPPGAEVITANSVVEPYLGCTDFLSRAEMAVNVLPVIVDRLVRKISQTDDIATLDPGYLKITYDYLRELRTAAIAMHEVKALHDRRLHELAGGYRLGAIIRNNAKDQAHEQAVRDNVAAALLQLEKEINGS